MLSCYPGSSHHIQIKCTYRYSEGELLTSSMLWFALVLIQLQALDVVKDSNYTDLSQAVQGIRRLTSCSWVYLEDLSLILQFLTPLYMQNLYQVTILCIFVFTCFKYVSICISYVHVHVLDNWSMFSWKMLSVISTSQKIFLK